MDPSSSIRCVGEELTVQWDERDALRPLKYKVELVKVRRTGYVRVVGMQGEDCFQVVHQGFVGRVGLICAKRLSSLSGMSEGT